MYYRHENVRIGSRIHTVESLAAGLRGLDDTGAASQALREDQQE